MASRRFSIVTDELSGRTRIRSYDIRVASQQYANIAGLLAGFAFTIVILVAQENEPKLTAIEILGRNLAAVSFFVSFFGCILTSFVFALISSEEVLTRRAHQMAFFAAAGFSSTISLLFWSIAAILKAFLVDEVALFAYQIFPLFVIIHPVYVVASVLDEIYIFDRRKPRLREYSILVGPSFLTILAACLLRAGGLTVTATLHLQSFYIIVWLLVFLIIIDNVVSAIFSTVDDDFRVNMLFSSFWMLVHSILISFLIIFL